MVCRVEIPLNVSEIVLKSCIMCTHLILARSGNILAMMIFRTHYDNLKVSREAPMVVINAAYKALCQTYHPDKYQGHKEEAERIFKIIVQSYGVLSDPVKKCRAIDRFVLKAD